MDRQQTAERDQQIARIREIFESTKDQAADGDEAGSAGPNDLLGDDLGPVARTPRARVRVLISQRPAVAYAVVAIAAAVVAAGVTWLSRPTSTPLEGASAPSQIATVDETNDDAVAVESSEADAAGSAAAAQDSAAPLVVSVVGMVAYPGLVTLAEGARVSDAIAAAGGVLPGTDLTTVNLARKVVDGEQIAVGVPGAADAGGSGDAGTAGDGGSTAEGAASGTPVNVNSASAQQLEALPGIGPVLAQSIVDYREQNGPFGKVEELSNVSGIGPAILAKLADLVTV